MGVFMVQKKQTYELCDLYDASREKINAKRAQYRVKFHQTIIRPSRIGEVIDSINEVGKENTYAMLKDSFLEFEQYLLPILEYMKDGDTYF